MEISKQKFYIIKEDQLKNVCGVLSYKGLPEAARDFGDTVRSQTLDVELYNANPFNRTCFGKFLVCPCDDECNVAENCKMYYEKKV